MKTIRPSNQWSSTRASRSKALVTIGIALVELAILLPWALHRRPDTQVEYLLSRPTIAQQFNKTQDLDQSAPGNYQSTLIHQAQGFARLINPPIPPVSTIPQGQAGSSHNTLTQQASIRLLATAYYPAQPDRSMALIAQAGLEPIWVKSGSRIGHILIEKISSGLVICKDGSRTIELKVDGSNTVASLGIGRPSGPDDPDAR